tara:strand:- start:260 stop:415 length:156 start_codon:yes stop_codon:yes gene_type:complete
MKNTLASTRSKYLFLLGVLAIGIGVVSKKVISYPTECLPMNNKEISFLFKI